MVFGLALSIGAISLIGSLPQTTTELVFDVSTFGFSFAIIILTWLRYTRIMSVLPLKNRHVIMLNILLLFFVALEPFLYQVLKVSKLDEIVSTAAFALDLGIMFLILGGFELILSGEEKKLIPKELVAHYRSEAIGTLTVGAFFVGSIVVPVPDPGVNTIPQVLYGIPLVIGGVALRYWFWILPLIIGRSGVASRRNL